MFEQLNPIDYKEVIWAPSTVKEIQDFYDSKFLKRMLQNPVYLFPENISEFGLYLLFPVNTNDGQKEFIRRSNIGLNTPAKLRNICQDLPKHDPQKRILNHSPPKGLYFKLNDIKEHGWLLAFDIDAKHIAQEGRCPCHSNAKREILSIPPFEYPYCFNCLYLTIQYAYQILNILMKWGFPRDKITIYYSGQGCHVHVHDPICWNFGISPRKHIQQLLIRNYDIPLDPVVTCDTSRVLRYPGSLNANVNLPVQKIIEEKAIDAFEKVIGYAKNTPTYPVNQFASF